MLLPLIFLDLCLLHFTESIRSRTIFKHKFLVRTKCRLPYLVRPVGFDQCQCSGICMTHDNSRAVLQNRTPELQNLLSSAHLPHTVLQGWEMTQYMSLCISSDFSLMPLDTKLAVLTNSISCLITVFLTSVLRAFG